MNLKRHYLLVLFLTMAWGNLISQAVDTWPVVLKLPGMDDVPITHTTYKSIDKTELRMDVYYPSDFDHKIRLPAVIIHNCVSMENPDLKGIQDWGRLIAVSGMIGITHQSRFFEAEDTHDLVDYLRVHADELGIDAEHLGILTTSGNGLVGMPLAMDKDRTYIRCAAVYYTMPDPDDVEPLKPLRQDISLFIVRCGLDEFRANRNIDHFIPMALDADVDLELINYLEGHHAFDIVDDNDRSRDIIRKTLDFFKNHLFETGKQKPSFTFTAKNFYALLDDGYIEEAKKRFSRKVEEMRGDTVGNPFYHREIVDRGLSLTARQFIQSGKTDVAVEVIHLMLESYPESPMAHINAADAFYACGKISLATQTAERAIVLIEESNQLNPDQKEALRKNVLAKMKGWKK